MARILKTGVKCRGSVKLPQFYISKGEIFKTQEIKLAWNFFHFEYDLRILCFIVLNF